ncbi:MAG: hypothetical protein J6I61_06610 [Prevotella sp.]|nr:hypothetical protein [Prevotella sp.]
MMKTNKFFQDKETIVTFLFAAFMMIGFVSVMVINYTEERSKNTGMLMSDYITVSMDGKEVSFYTDEMIAATKKLEAITHEKASLERKKAMVAAKLAQTRSDRNREYGMVAGLYNQSISDVSEINYLQGKLKSIDKKICRQQQKEDALLAKYGDGIKKMVYNK